MPKLVVEEDGDRRELSLADEPVVIGRDLENAIVIRDSMSSRRHCQVRQDGDRYVIEDLKSSNGTLLNGVTTPQSRLGDGDVIQVGQVRITFHAEGAAGANGAAEVAPVGTTVGAAQPDDGVEATVTVEVFEGPGSGTELTIEELPLLIGRRKDCGLVIPDRRISSQHAEVRREGGEWIIVDLDSGNGLFVGKRRIKRHVLMNGQAIVVGGDSKIRFSGLPEVPTAAAELPLGKAAQPIRVTDQFAGEFAEASRRVSVSDVDKATSPLQIVFTGAFLISFVVILYFGSTLVADFLQTYRPPAIEGNLITNANWSFEQWGDDGKVESWIVDSNGDAATLSAIEEGAPHGQRALELSASGGAKVGFVRALCDEVIPISPTEVLELSGKLKNEGFRVAGLQIVWLKRTDSGFRVVDQTATQLIRPRASFSNLKRTLAPRAIVGADACQVALLGWGGRGSLVADEIVLRKSEAERTEPAVLAVESSISKDRDLKFTFDEGGTFAVQRGRQLAIRNVWLATFEEGKVPFGQRLPLTSEAPQADDGGALTSGTSFLDPSGEPALFQTRAQVVGELARVTFQDLSAGTQRAVLFEFDPNVLELPVAAYKRNSVVGDVESWSDLDGALTDEWVVGERMRQLVITFSETVECRVVAMELTDGRPTMAVVLGGGFDGGALDVYFSTSNRREEARIAAAFRSIDEHRQNDRLGEVLGVLDRLTADLPWRNDLADRASTLRAEILAAGESRLEELRAIRSDLAKYGAPPVRSLFVGRAQQIADAFRGTAIAAEVDKILADANAATGAAEDRRTARRAEDLVARAQSLFDSRQDATARLYCERVVTEFEGTESARRAREILMLIKARD